MAHDGSNASKSQLSQELPPQYEEAETHLDPALESGPVIPRSNRSLERQNEQSPLLSPQQTLDGDGGARRRADSPADILEWDEGDGQETKSVWYLFLLTLGIGG